MCVCVCVGCWLFVGCCEHVGVLCERRYVCVGDTVCFSRCVRVGAGIIHTPICQEGWGMGLIRFLGPGR